MLLLYGDDGGSGGGDDGGGGGDGDDYDDDDDDDDEEEEDINNNNQSENYSVPYFITEKFSCAGDVDLCEVRSIGGIWWSTAGIRWDHVERTSWHARTL